jgi:protein-tyrosine phosphatase
MKGKVKVLFVCMGNICRSPTAHGVFRHLVEAQGYADLIEIDSAGTHSYHIGKPPDQRGQQAAVSRGIDIGDLRARQVNQHDFSEFDYVIAMDNDNFSELEDICPADQRQRLHMMMDFAPERSETEVPDPYYSGEFGRVFDMVDVASRGLLQHIIQAGS